MSRLVPYGGGTSTGVVVASGNASPAVVAAGAVNGQTPARDRIEALAKYVPAEILAFYVPAVPAISLLKHPAWVPWAHWAAFLVAWALVPLYFHSIGKHDARRNRQMFVSSLAFPIWAYVSNRTIGPLAPWYDDAFGVLLMLGFSLATAFLLPERQRA